jgi:hypothetical protein
VGQRRGCVPASSLTGRSSAPPDPCRYRHKKHILICSWAGRPIFSRYGDETVMAGAREAARGAPARYTHHRRSSLHGRNLRHRVELPEGRRYAAVHRRRGAWERERVRCCAPTRRARLTRARSAAAQDYKFVFLLRGPIYLVSIRCARARAQTAAGACGWPGAETLANLLQSHARVTGAAHATVVLRPLADPHRTPGGDGAWLSLDRRTHAIPTGSHGKHPFHPRDAASGSVARASVRTRA